MSEFIPTAHPVLKLPSRKQGLAMGAEKLMEFLIERERLIEQEKDDPYSCGYVLPCWNDADKLMQAALLTCLFGGNGSAKTYFGAWKGVRTLVEQDKSKVLWLHESEATSVDIQQAAVYNYLPKIYRETKFKRNSGAAINYVPKSGFSENKFVLPNGSWGRFGSYKQDLKDYEGHGWTLVVADEDLPLNWLKTLLFRLPRAGGKMIWSFTPIRGITPAIQHVVDGAATIESRPVDPLLLDPNTRYVQDCPPGFMPYIQQAIRADTKIIYFFSEMNPYGNYPGTRGILIPLDREQKERRAYGYSRKTRGRLFPLFGKVHVIPPEKIPNRRVIHGHVADPAGSRNMFQFWAKVDEYGRHFVYREWPDVPTYGEWAVQAENARLFDGEPGPAQPTMGFGVIQYKKIILEAEGNKFEGGKWVMTGEDIFERIMDPRSGKAQTVTEDTGEKTLMDRMEEEQWRESELVGPSLVFVAGSGVNESEGIQAINDLLFYKPEEPVVPLMNEPKLYISSECQNLIWALQNYTGRDGEKAACKDPIDCLRYMALADLQYVSEENYKTSGAQGY